MKNPNKQRHKRKTHGIENDRVTSIREIPAKRFCPAYFEDLEADNHIKKYIVIKDIGYMDDTSYIIKAVIA